MTNDLKSMSSKELEKLLISVKKALQSAKARDQREAKRAATKAAAEFGFTLGELSEKEIAQPSRLKKKPKVAKKPAKAVYANPSDKNQTWTGKGRQPNWYRAEVEKGTAPEEMRI